MTDDALSEFDIAADTAVAATVGSEFEIDRWNDRLAAVAEPGTPAGLDPLSLFARSDRDAVADAVGRCLGAGHAEVSAVLAGDGRWHDVTLTRRCGDSGVPVEIVLIARPRPEGTTETPFLDPETAVEPEQQAPMLTR